MQGIINSSLPNTPKEGIKQKVEKEKLIIRNFGPIKKADLDFKKINVLIGESGTGKSTILKLIDFCRFFSNIEGTYFDEVNRINKNIVSDKIYDRLKKSNLFDFINDDSLVRYECDFYNFEFSKKKWVNREEQFEAVLDLVDELMKTM